MKTNKISTIGLACLLSLGINATLQAQQLRSCGSMENQTRLETLYPELKKNQAEIEEHTQNYLLSNAKVEAATINIPVVVHVVYNSSSQNISNAQIISQIDVLNEDFQKLNADKSLIPSAFSSLAANCNISFCLATKDPSGNPTSGIIRKLTSTISFSQDDKVKSSSTGGDNAWNTSKYLNIWVCNLGSSLLGYAQFPGGPTATDGVVILYTAFGRTGNVVSPFNKGRTATHEVGHWLNLRHIWGDANCGNDFVNDTPAQQTSNTGCPSYPHITCNNSGDMSMNYMDYTNDACMYMFSTGQSSRMNALFASNGARVGLLTSSGCGTSNVTGTTVATTSLVTIGNGANTTGVVPYGTYYMDERAQIIITKSELQAVGFTGNNKYIKSLAFNALTAVAQTMGSFTIKMSHVTNTSFGSTSFLTGNNAVTVYSSNFAASSNQWNTHNFTTPFVYNGTDNILIDICWNNASYTNNTSVYASATTNYMTLYKRQDITSGGLCATTSGTQSNSRPNMKLSLSTSSMIASGGSSSARLQDDGITTPKELETTLYPNPVNDKLTLSYTIYEENATSTVDIFDLFGRKVKSFTVGKTSIGENIIEINFTTDSELQNLQNGIYFISLIVNGEKTTKKLVLDRR